MRSDTFGRLLKAGIGSIASTEGRTAPAVEAELGELISVGAASIQRYKAGHIPPEPRAVAILAEQCVRRGLMGASWLQQLLAAARYPAAHELAERLLPSAPARQRPPRVYHNLPAPTYSQFVMRSQAFAEILDGLAQRSAVVLVVGLGGNGKTSLAREVAAHCLRGDAGVADVEAAVWVSDKDRPGTTSLSTVLDEIARTLDYPGLTQLAHDEKRFEVEQLLRRQRVLLLVDNFETIGDGALLAWLLRLPEPSKALVTSRAYSRAFRNSTVVVELRGMQPPEARDLIALRLRLLRLEGAVPEAQIAPLIAVTGGNAKAIELALGVVKYERRPIPLVLDDLRAARGELFEDLFTRAWALLDEAARRLLLAMTLFPVSAHPAALAASADVATPAFERAREQLTDLALLDGEQPDMAGAARLTLHPLVRAFARARLADDPGREASIRARWRAWYRAFAERVGERWYDTGALAELDPETENVQAVIDWCARGGDSAGLLFFTGLLGYYAYVRGRWDWQWAINELRLEAARAAGDRAAEVFTLTNMLRVRTLQGERAAAAGLAELLETLLGQVALDTRGLSAVRHALAMHALLGGERERGRELLARVLADCAGRDAYKFNRARNWLAESLMHEGRLDEAQRLFEESLAASEQIGYHRSVTFCQVRLAGIALARGDAERADELLRASRGRAEAAQDRRDLALIDQTSARLHALRGDHGAARAAQAAAIDVFTRLGMRRELAEARTTLG